MSKEEWIGTEVVEAQERRRRYVAKMQPLWMQIGAELRKVRDSLKISRREIAEKIGVSESVLARLEAGCPIKRRNMVETSYRTMLHCIPLLRKENAGLA